MAIQLYNTMTRSKERFEPADPPRVTMYVCGPTVYSYPHIGNARPAVVFDVLARLLRRDYDLTYARNITDVEDKINAAAKEEGVDIHVITGKIHSGLPRRHEGARRLASGYGTEGDRSSGGNRRDDRAAAGARTRL